MNKLTKLGTLTFEDGWMGGQWKVGIKPVKKADFPSEVIIELDGVKVRSTPVTSTRVDHDHGHRYAWTALDFQLKLNSPIGELQFSLREYITMRQPKVVEIYIES